MPGPTRKRRPWLALLLVAATALVFGRTLGHGFVLIDDDRNVYTNPLVHPEGDASLLQAWREPYLLYIPVTYDVWALVARGALVPEGGTGERAENRLEPGPFHAANVTVHILSVLVVFALLRNLLGLDFAAAIGALLFAVHPLQVEPVAWVSGMKDVLSGFLGLLCLWLYVLHARASGRGLGPWAAALAAFVLAILSKPSAVVIPLMAAVLDVGVLRRGWRSAAASLWPFFAVALGRSIAAIAIQPTDAAVATVPLWARSFVAGDALAFYLGKLVWPVSMAPFYDRSPQVVLAGGSWWLGTAVCASLLLGAWVARRRWPLPLGALLLFAAGLAPVLGLVPFVFQVHSTVADRYTYLALLGPALLLAALVRGRAPAQILAVLALGAAGLRARDQVELWRDSRALFEHNLKVHPASSFVHSNLGEVLAREDDVDAAIEHFREAVRLAPESAQLRNNLGTYLGQRGRLDEALEQLSEAVRLDPDYARARMGLASTLIGLGRYAEAVEQLQEVHRIEPDFAPAYLSRGQLQAALGDLRAAARAYEEALRADPELVEARVQLAGIYLQGNQVQEAIATLRTAVDQAPDMALAQAELGRALMISNRPIDAQPYLEQALRLDPSLDYVRPMLEAARRGR